MGGVENTLTPLTLTPLTPSRHIGWHRAVTPLCSARKAEDERSHSGVIAKDERRMRLMSFSDLTRHFFTFYTASLYTFSKAILK